MRKIVSYERDGAAREIAGTLRRDGAVIVRNALDPEVADELLAQLEPHLEREETGGGAFYGGRTKSFGNLFARDRSFSEHLLLNSMALEVTDHTLLPQFPMGGSQAVDAAGDAGPNPGGYDVLDLFAQAPRDPVHGPNCHHYRVHFGGGIQVWPGGGLQPLHREMDTYRPFIEHEPGQPDYVVAMNWAITDFTAENGATRIGLGSHRWPADRAPTEGDEAQAVMPKGSVLFWLGRTLHGLGANRTDRPRTGIITVFSADWLAQEENQFLAVPPEMARALPEKVQRLLGYRASIIGYVTGLDPENLLRSGRGGPI